MFSQTVEYALRAVVFLASQQGRLVGAPEIAEGMDMPPSYVVKVLQQLTRVNIVNSKRGKGGGFALALPADEISLLSVINAVDPIKRIETCPLNLKEHCDKLCPLHSKLDASYAAMESTFANAFVSEMIAQPKKKKSKTK